MDFNTTVKIPFSQIFYLNDSLLPPPTYEFSAELQSDNLNLEANSSPSIGSNPSLQTVIRLPTPAQAPNDTVGITQIAETETGIEFTFDVLFDDSVPVNGTVAVIINLIVSFLNNFTDANPSITFSTSLVAQAFPSNPQETNICGGVDGIKWTAETNDVESDMVYPDGSTQPDWEFANHEIGRVFTPAAFKFTPNVTVTPTQPNPPNAASATVQVTILPSPR